MIQFFSVIISPIYCVQILKTRPLSLHVNVSLGFKIRQRALSKQECFQETKDISLHYRPKPLRVVCESVPHGMQIIYCKLCFVVIDF